MDRAVALSAGWNVMHVQGDEWLMPPVGSPTSAPRYTSSLDAAMSLVPKDWHITVRGLNDSWHVSMNPTRRGPIAETFAFAATPALALTAAALRARAALLGEE
ncbi:hypothetical protein Q5H94_02150 [Sphingomonas sp. CA1-15]|uniref:Uncharacterized protein n=1 Tax=Sphingomonas immobilis TaxID=3063997 RepID=A0ABT8ZX98_9SPHN|nr:hypothetical protein [Sphingomonas sp. CA1-15]